MWYPEEQVTFCRRCEIDIPYEFIWRGRGYVITSGGHEVRTAVLYSQCPECGHRMSVGLDGSWPYRVLYQWLWKLRYPRNRPPRASSAAIEEQPRRRASGG